MLFCFCILCGGYKATTSSSVIMTGTGEHNPANLKYLLAAFFFFYRKCLLALEQDIIGIISYRLHVSILQTVRWMSLAHILRVPTGYYSRVIGL